MDFIDLVLDVLGLIAEIIDAKMQINIKPPKVFITVIIILIITAIVLFFL